MGDKFDRVAQLEQQIQELLKQFNGIEEQIFELKTRTNVDLTLNADNEKEQKR